MLSGDAPSPPRVCLTWCACVCVRVRVGLFGRYGTHMKHDLGAAEHLRLTDVLGSVPGLIVEGDTVFAVRY